MKEAIQQAANNLFAKLKSAGHFKKCNGEWELDQIKQALSQQIKPDTKELEDIKTEFEKYYEKKERDAIYNNIGFTDKDCWNFFIPYIITKSNTIDIKDIVIDDKFIEALKLFKDKNVFFYMPKSEPIYPCKNLEELKQNIVAILTLMSDPNLTTKNDVEEINTIAMEIYEYLISINTKSNTIDTEELRKKFIDTCRKGLFFELSYITSYPHINDIFDWFITNLQPNSKTSDIIEKVNLICEKSLSPDVFEMWKKVEEQLLNNRSDLK